MRTMRLTVGLALFVLALFVSSSEAGLRAQCRRQCDTTVATCVTTTGQRLRACRRQTLRRCRRDGLQFCAGATTTTTINTTTSIPVSSGPSTTTQPLGSTTTIRSSTTSTTASQPLNVAGTWYFDGVKTVDTPDCVLPYDVSGSLHIVQGGNYLIGDFGTPSTPAHGSITGANSFVLTSDSAECDSYCCCSTELSANKAIAWTGVLTWDCECHSPYRPATCYGQWTGPLIRQ